MSSAGRSVSESRSFRLGRYDRLLAAAAEGNASAIEALLADPSAIEAVGDHRIGPLLAHRMHELDMEVYPAWQSLLRNSAVGRMFLDEALSSLGRIFDAAGIPWLPLKGMGKVKDFFPAPECRPTSDLDVLIPPGRLDEARRLLLEKGWETEENDGFDPAEVYNWKARYPGSGILLELHYTLWGGVDREFAPYLLGNAGKDEESRRTVPESPVPDLFLISASHLWNSPLPRALLYFFELHLIAGVEREDSEGFSEAVIAPARRFDLQLPVGLAATIAGDLFSDPAAIRIGAVLLDDLRMAEKLALRLPGKNPTADLNLGVLTFARLLSGRKSRNGWKAVSRFLGRVLRCGGGFLCRDRID